MAFIPTGQVYVACDRCDRLLGFVDQEPMDFEDEADALDGIKGGLIPSIMGEVICTECQSPAERAYLEAHYQCHMCETLGVCAFGVTMARL